MTVLCAPSPGTRQPGVDLGALCLWAPPKPGPEKNAPDRLSDMKALGRPGCRVPGKKRVNVSPEECRGKAPSWSTALNSMS